MRELEFEKKINEILKGEINNEELFNNDFNNFYTSLLNRINIFNNELVSSFNDEEKKQYYSFICSIKDLYIMKNALLKIMNKNIDEISKKALENDNIEKLLNDELDKIIEKMGFIKNGLKIEHDKILRVIYEEYDKYLMNILDNVFNIISSKDYLLNNVSNKRFFKFLKFGEILNNMDFKLLCKYLENNNYEIVYFISDDLFCKLSKTQIKDILKNINLNNLSDNKLQYIIKSLSLQELFSLINLDNYSILYKNLIIDNEEDLDYLIENNKLVGIESCNSVINNKSFVKKLIQNGKHEIFSFLSPSDIDDEILSLIDCDKIINSNDNSELNKLLKNNKVFEKFLFEVSNKWKLFKKIGVDNITKDMVNICVVNEIFMSKEGNVFDDDWYMNSDYSMDVSDSLIIKFDLADAIKFAYENNRMDYCEYWLLSANLYYYLQGERGLKLLNVLLNIYKNEPEILAYIEFLNKNNDIFSTKTMQLIKNLIKSTDDIKRHFDEFGPVSDEFFDLAFKNNQIYHILNKYYNLKGHYKDDLAVSNYLNMYLYLPNSISYCYIGSRENIYNYFRMDGSFTDKLYNLVLTTGDYQGFIKFNLKEHYKDDLAIISYIDYYNSLPSNIRTIINKESIYKYFNVDGSIKDELYDLVLIKGNLNYNKLNLKEHYKDDLAIISYIDYYNSLPSDIRTIINKESIYKYFNVDGSIKDELYDLVLIKGNFNYNKLNLNLKEHYKDDKSIINFINFVEIKNIYDDDERDYRNYKDEEKDELKDIIKNKNDIYIYFNEFGLTKEFYLFLKNNKNYEKKLLKGYINNYLSLNEINYNSFNFFKLYIINEYFNRNKEKYDNALKYLGSNVLLNLSNENVLKLINVDNDNLKIWYENGSLQQLFDLITTVDLSSDLMDYFVSQKKLDVPFEYLDILNSYQYDKIQFLVNYNLYINFLHKMNIEEAKFIQYGFNVDFDWFSSMLNIINNNKVEEFISIKEYFYKITQSNNEISRMKTFIKILINYQKYPELCTNILNQDLSQELIDNIIFLFNSTDSIDYSLIKNTSDLLNLKEIFKNKYQILMNQDMSIDDIKNNLCKLLFNMNLKTVLNKLKIYGNTKDLRQLIFNNRNNIKIIDSITEMMIYTSMMEAIYFCNDLDYLIEMGKKVLDNYDSSLNCMMLFSDFDEKMRILYENELITNLTTLNNNIEGLKDEELSKEYGVDVIDFSDKKYCLAYHVKSKFENYDELINGLSTRDKSTICLSIGSNRNQIVYHKNGLIFATDELPNGVFIRSSTHNMGSNGTIKKGSFKDTANNSIREQRGALETSIAPYGNNSEVLCFRSGVKFKYIILPGGAKPSNEIIEIAKKYNLKFIKTQNLYESINIPKEIDSRYLKVTDEKLNQHRIDNLRKIKENLIIKNKKPRQIAIFTDSHALFEPTLAILEDARKCGITEIYSLGDNIGTGPNPKEVMELLNEYGVKSLKGNHEIYSTSGVEKLKSHLKSAYEEAKVNSDWTRKQLTFEQKNEIKNNPEDRIIEIGGEKILLTHFVRNYNTGCLKNISDDIKNVFQGHIHFEKKALGKIITLRGAGIGHDSRDIGKAFYIILTERLNGGYDIEKRFISYDINNLKYDILESNMEDKTKIESWVGIKK